MKNAFKVGDRVANLVSSHDTNVTYGKVIMVEAPNSYLVEWDNKSITRFKATNLMLESEAKVLKDKLSAEFAAIENSILSKIKESTAALKEAIHLARAKNISISEMYDINSELMDAMDEAGWNTSSYRC
jgi:hypothetical protein